MSLTSVADALTAITTRIPRLPAHTVPLAQLPGCGLTQAIAMERDQPPFDRVAMDGIAVRSAGTALSLRVTGTQAAGDPPQSLHEMDDCIEVMTGAQLPHGADCVIPVEALRIEQGHAQLAPATPRTAWQHIHRQGSDAHAGATVLSAGKRLDAIDIAVLASAGYAQAQACHPPRMALVSTGNELVEPGLPIEPWQIRRSNIHAVRAALQLHGFTQLQDEHIDDDPQALRTRLAALLNTHDVLVLSGGVSMGKFDHVPRVLTELNVQCVLHKIAQKPGKPMWFGVRADGKAVFALPGNPVSTLMCLHRYVLPGLYAMMGCTPPRHDTMPIRGSVRSSPDLTLFVPFRFADDASLGQVALLAPTRGSGDFMSLQGTDGFVQIPAGTVLTPATVLPCFRW